MHTILDLLPRLLAPRRDSRRTRPRRVRHLINLPLPLGRSCTIRSLLLSLLLVFFLLVDERNEGRTPPRNFHWRSTLDEPIESERWELGDIALDLVVRVVLAYSILGELNE